MAESALRPAQGPDDGAWWALFDADPQGAVDAMLRGKVTVSPWARYDPAQVMQYLFRPLAAGHGRWSRLDDAMAAWLARRLEEKPEERGHLRAAHAIAVGEGLAAAARLRLPASHRLLRARLDEFQVLAAELSLPRLDLVARLWQAMALCQPDRTLLGRWYEWCDQAGRQGEAGDARLETALLGLRRLPRRRAEDWDLGDEVLSGLARWARHLEEGEAERTRFLARWRVLMALYPSTGVESPWPNRLRPLLAAHAGRPFARWWAETVGMDLPAPAGDRAAASGWQPGKADTDQVLRAIRPLSGHALAERVEDFVRRHRAYADASLDHSQIGPALHRIGTAVLGRAPALALSLAETALEYRSSVAYCLGLAAEALEGLGRVAAAEAQLWRAIDDLTGSAHLRNQLARLVERQGRVGEAEALYRAAHHADPDNRAAPSALGHLLLSQGRPGEAEGVFRQALRRDGGDGPDWTDLALALEQQGRGEEAEALLEQAAERFAHDPFPRTALAAMTLRSGDAALAERRYRQVMADFPDNAVCRTDLAIELVWQGRAAEAEELIAQLQRLDPGSARTVAGHLERWRRGEERRRDKVDRHALAPVGWTELGPAAALRAAFLHSPALNDNQLVLLDSASRRALRDEADAALAAAWASHRHHPVVRLVAVRRGLIPLAELPAMGAGGDFALALELARRSGRAGDLAPLAEAATWPQAPLAWLAQARLGEVEAVTRLIAWAGGTGALSPALDHVRRRLKPMLGNPALGRLPPAERARMVGQTLSQVADDLLDVAVLSLVVGGLNWDEAIAGAA